MRKIIAALCLLLLSFNVYAVPVTIDPGTGLVADDGPFGFGGRGFVFRAEQNFSMNSLGMDLNFPGTLDFYVSVYAVNGTSRGALISETAYLGMTDDGSAFFTLAHSESFIAGNTYEIILRFSNPGVIFTHYDFDNPSLNPANGFAAGTEMLILDGSDLNNGYGNTWLARFQLDVGPPAIVYPPGVPIPTLGLMGLAVLIFLMVAVVGWKRRAFVSRG